MAIPPMGNHLTTQPTSIQIHLASGAGVDVEWADGHRSHYEFDYLREQCPCATCRASREGGQQQTVLLLDTEKLRAVEAVPVGHYAVRFVFSDGHSTGIYSFGYLREICPCVECQTGRKGSATQ